MIVGRPRLPPGQRLLSYDIKALFTSVPVDKALQVITSKLEEADTLPERSALSVQQLTELLDFCLNTIYFIYDGCFYQQTHSAAMGSPGSPIVDNLYMEHFDETTLSTVPTTPSMWLRYIDDTFV